MIKRLKKLLAVGMMVFLVICAFVEWSEFLVPWAIKILALIAIGAVIIWFLNKSRNHKITTVIVYVVAGLAVLAMIFWVPTRRPIAIIVGISAGIYICYRITKNVNEDINKDNKDNIIDFKRPKK